MKKQKVLIIHNYYQITGGEDTVVANEKKMLEEHGHEVIVYSRNNSELRTMFKLKKLLLPLSTIFNFKTYFDIKKIIHKNQIDVIHVHNTLNLVSPSVYYAAIKCKVPVVQTIHNFRLLCPGATFYRDGHICEDCVTHGLGCAVRHSCYRDSKLQTLLCVISTKIHRMTGIYGKLNYICLTDFNREKLLQLNQIGKRPLIDPQKVFIKPNFTFEPKNLSRVSDQYYLFIGRVEKIKGMEILLEAFKRLPKQKLKIAGTGTDLDIYKNQMERHHIQNVEFCGFLNREQLEVCLSAAKAVIVPSQWYETFGMIIAEAYATGKPVIVGDIGNIATLVDEGKTGIKFRYDSPEALADAIIRFEETDHTSWNDNAYQKFRNELAPEINYKVLDEIYRKIITDKTEVQNGG